MDETGRLSFEEVRGWIRRFAGQIIANKVYLTELDSAIGDADHGINMDRGFQAAIPKLDAFSGDDPGAACKLVGSTEPAGRSTARSSSSSASPCPATTRSL